MLSPDRTDSGGDGLRPYRRVEKESSTHPKTVSHVVILVLNSYRLPIWREENFTSDRIHAQLSLHNARLALSTSRVAIWNLRLLEV